MFLCKWKLAKLGICYLMGKVCIALVLLLSCTIHLKNINYHLSSFSIDVLERG